MPPNTGNTVLLQILGNYLTTINYSEYYTVLCLKNMNNVQQNMYDKNFTYWNPHPTSQHMFLMETKSYKLIVPGAKHRKGWCMRVTLSRYSTSGILTNYDAWSTGWNLSFKSSPCKDETISHLVYLIRVEWAPAHRYVLSLFILLNIKPFHVPSAFSPSTTT